MKKIHIMFFLLLLVFIISCTKKSGWSRKYEIITEGNIHTGTLEKSNYPCNSDSDCREFCWDLGGGSIGYQISCRENFCVCSAPPYAD